MANFEIGSTVAGYEITHLGNINQQLALTSAYTTHAQDMTKHVTQEQIASWNGAETRAIDFAKSFGLGGPAKNISNTNINSLVETGFYMGERLTGVPPEVGIEWCYVINIMHNSFYKKQLILPLSNSSLTSQFWQRTQVNGTWSTYSRLLDSTMLNQPNGVAKLGPSGKLMIDQLSLPSIAFGEYLGDGVIGREIFMALTPSVVHVTRHSSYYGVISQAFVGNLGSLVLNAAGSFQAFTNNTHQKTNTIGMIVGVNNGSNLNASGDTYTYVAYAAPY